VENAERSAGIFERKGLPTGTIRDWGKKGVKKGEKFFQRKKGHESLKAFRRLAVR